MLPLHLLVNTPKTSTFYITSLSSYCIYRLVYSRHLPAHLAGWRQYPINLLQLTGKNCLRWLSVKVLWGFFLFGMIFLFIFATHKTVGETVTCRRTGLSSLWAFDKQTSHISSCSKLTLGFSICCGDPDIKNKDDPLCPQIQNMHKDSCVSSFAANNRKFGVLFLWLGHFRVREVAQKRVDCSYLCLRAYKIATRWAWWKCDIENSKEKSMGFKWDLWPSSASVLFVGEKNSLWEL